MNLDPIMFGSYSDPKYDEIKSVSIAVEPWNDPPGYMALLQIESVKGYVIKEKEWRKLASQALMAIYNGPYTNYVGTVRRRRLAVDLVINGQKVQMPTREEEIRALVASLEPVYTPPPWKPKDWIKIEKLGRQNVDGRLVPACRIVVGAYPNAAISKTMPLADGKYGHDDVVDTIEKARREPTDTKAREHVRDVTGFPRDSFGTLTNIVVNIRQGKKPSQHFDVSKTDLI